MNTYRNISYSLRESDSNRIVLEIDTSNILAGISSVICYTRELWNTAITEELIQKTITNAIDSLLEYSGFSIGALNTYEIDYIQLNLDSGTIITCDASEFGGVQFE